MAIGAYAMAILVVDGGLSFWLALPLAVLAAMPFGLLVGLPSLRLRADYFAIATIAAAEILRIVAQNARGPDRRQPGPLRLRATSTASRHWSTSRTDPRASAPIGSAGATRSRCSRCFLVVWVTVADRRRSLLSRPQRDALGAGAAGGPRGRGRRPGAGQERLLLQAPVAGDRGRAGRARGLLPGPQPELRHPRRLRADRSPSSASRC